MRLYRRLPILFLFASLLQPALAHAESWTQPTPEELSMTSQPEVPGASAVILDYEQITNDQDHQTNIYMRLKVLTEDGRKYGDVRIGYGLRVAHKNDMVFELSVAGVAGRTIHSDGTVIPFTGKPFQRKLVKASDVEVRETAFAMPDVEVGSILEYRYTMDEGPDFFIAPTWYIQQDLFMRKAYYCWMATDDNLIDPLRGAAVLRIAWTPVLPAGQDMKFTKMPSAGRARDVEASNKIELHVHDIPPAPDEDHMLPVDSFTYRVMFYFSPDASTDAFWKNEGKAWSKSVDHFIGSNLKSQAQSLVSDGDSDTVKLQKIYAAVMAMDNTNFSRTHDTDEDKANGLKEAKSASDVWDRKRGYDDQLTDLFVGLARAAGFKAYVMRVTNRDHNIFWSAWLTLNQLDDDLAIVVLDGKERFFDPGQRYCPFGQMAWKHTGVIGPRQLEDGSTKIAITSEPPSTESQTQRVGDFVVSADGSITGPGKITWFGAPALDWRQQGLREDEEAVKRSMRNWLQNHVPAGVETEITGIDNLVDYEQPLIAHYTVHGTIGTATERRLILPDEFFEAKSSALFPEPTRQTPVYFDHTERVVDAVRYKFPADCKLEAAPSDDSLALQDLAAYHVQSESQPGYVLVRRTYDLGASLFKPTDYPEIHTFFDKLAADDQRLIIIDKPSAK